MVWNQDGQGSRYTLYKVKVETADNAALLLSARPFIQGRTGIAAIDLNAALAKSTASLTAISPAFGRLRQSVHRTDKHQRLHNQPHT
jgi:hypothetical protein